MSTPTRYSIKIAGESGSLSTAGNIVIDCLRHLGFYVYSEREFPSLIKGGRANIQINFAKYPVRSLSHQIQVGVALDREGVLDCLDTLGYGSILINGFDRWQKVIKDLPTQVEEKGIILYDIPAREITEKLGGSAIMVNTVLVGFLFKVLGLDLEPMIIALTKQLSKKPDLLEINKNCAKFGFEYDIELSNRLDLEKLQSDNAEAGELPLNKGLAAQADWGYKSDTTHYGDTVVATTNPSLPSNHIFVDGNTAICLGALQAGCRAHYQYPMSPSTTVLTTFAAWAEKTGMLVKQAEDEITAIQMALGSMHTGTRAMTATSGGGFDLMTETISLAGMIETPCVCVIVQRPGPATGLPTWTGQADLNLAIHSGHGEYGKLVIACSDVQSCYENIQHAFDLADKFQIPVMLLSEANIGMSSVTVPAFEQDLIPINRYLTTENLAPNLRYQITQSGISNRWIPGTDEAIYFANSDEHYEDGSLDESLTAGDMIAKRVRKLKTIEDSLPEPEIYSSRSGSIPIYDNQNNKDKDDRNSPYLGGGKTKSFDEGSPAVENSNSILNSFKSLILGKLEKVVIKNNSKTISFVGWGSTKSTIIDAIDQLAITNPEVTINYLHFNYMFPLKTTLLIDFLKVNPDAILIEGNATGQLGELITTKTGIQFADKMLKWNGRPFYVEEIINKILKY